MPSNMQLRLAPYLMVFLSSTSWVVVKFVAPYAGPLTFLVVRYVFALMAGALIVYTMAAKRPSSRQETAHMMLSGIMMYTLFGGMTWWSIIHGIPAGVSAIIGAGIPLLSAALGPLHGEPTTKRQWLGIVIGFLGVATVFSPKLAGGSLTGAESDALPIFMACAAIVIFTIGTHHQKHFLANTDLRTLVTYQHAGALLAVIPLLWLIEPIHFEIRIETVLGLIWAVVFISLLTMMLFFHLTRRYSVASANSLQYLVAPLVVLEAYLLFGEKLTVIQLFGMVLAAAGVYLVMHKPQPAIAVREL